MAQFQYEARTADERWMSGTLEAQSPEEAREALEQMGLTIQELEKLDVKPPRSPLGHNEFRLFNQQLSAIADAGIPMERALRELARDVASHKVRGLLHTLANELEAGKPFEEAFAQHESLFPPMYSQVLKAGIQTGRLGSMLASLNRHLETAQQTRRILMEAATYPLLILLFSLGLASFFLHIAIPSFKMVYSNIGGRLPYIVEIALNMQHSAGTFWICLAIFFGAMLSGYLVLRSTPKGRKTLEGMLLRVPILGWIFRASTISRFSDAMGLLVGGGHDLPESLRLAGASTGCETLREESELWAQQIESGKSMGEASKACHFLPAYFLYSLQIGAQRNELQDSFYFLSSMYKEQVLATQGRLQATLMPFLLIIVGLIIGVLTLALMSPYFAIFEMASNTRTY